MPTYRMTVEYDGSEFCGWQIQPDEPSVQESLEDALATALRVPVKVVGSGRTDAGVHARHQVAHFHFNEPVDTFRLLASLNGILPPSVAVRSLREVEDAFHARYDARVRTYHYHVTTGFRALDRHMRLRIHPEPDFNRMNVAARDLLGEHDFHTFCRTQSGTKNRVCTLHVARWMAESDAGDWRFEISGNRFLHGMVRAIVGTLLEIGQEDRPIDDIPRLLAARDRRHAGPAVPAFGLVLEDVLYEGDL